MEKEEIKELIETLIIKMDNARRSGNWAEYQRLLDDFAISMALN